MVERDDQPKETKHYTVVIEQLGTVGAKVLIWLLVAGIALGYFWFKYYHLTRIASPEAYEYGQIAKRNLRGEWFQTNLIRPVGLWLDRDVRNQPDLFHPPAYSVVLAGLMAIAGSRDAVLLWGSGLFYFLVMPVVYFASRSMFNKRIARLGLFFLLIMPAIGIAAVSGSPALLATFLITSLFALLSAIRPRRYLLTAATGLALAACALVATRYVLLVAPAVGYLVLTLRRKAWVHVPILVAIVALALLPWARRNVQLSGSPWPPMEWTASYQLSEESKRQATTQMRPTLASSDPIENSFSPEALGISLWGREGGRSLARNLRLALGDLVRYGAQSVLVVLFVAGILVRSKNRYTEWLRIALYVAITIDLVYGAVARPDGFLLLPYLPFMAVIGAFVLLELIQRLGYTRPISRFALIAVAIVVAVVQALIATNPSEALTEADLHRYYTCQVLKHIGKEKMLEPKAVVLSNVPWHTAWYLDRPSIWLPPSYDDLLRLQMQTGEHVTFAFLTGYALDKDAPSYEIWHRALSEGRMPDSFRLVPFFSTVLSRKDIFSSFITKERRDLLIEEIGGGRKTSEPKEDKARPNGQEGS